MANGSRETTTNTKMMVRLAISTFSAISLGVFWRLAPSTRAIMRSRNVSPGLALICTTIQSASTRVLPVTALRLGLRFTASLGHGFCEVGEDHGEPQPDGHRQNEGSLGS